MDQKRNKIIMLGLGGIILMIGLLVFIAQTTLKTKNIVPIGLQLIGTDPDTGVEEKTIPLNSVLVEVKKIENSKEVKISQAITNEKGEAIFKLEKNKEYNFYVTPQTFFNYLYDYSRFPYKLNTKEIEGEFILGINLSLREEVKRDIQRRNDLLIYQAALEKYKTQRGGKYPLADSDILSLNSTTYQRLKPYLDKVNLNSFDPSPLRYYRYTSDGNSYLLLAYPETDLRSSLEMLKEYKGERVYLIGDSSLEVVK